jgi:16S rRNA (guanine966-N2)-methyltransferase
MRVIAGQYRSRPLRSLPGVDIRPTTDRLRETLFDVLCAGNPAALEGTVWLDLFAGTGAVGIEALSRGAKMVYFAESSAKASTVIRQNLQSLNIEAGFEIIQQDTLRALRLLSAQAVTANFVFFDPPYRMQASYAETLNFLATPNLIAPSALVIAEHPRRFDPGIAFGLLQRYRKLEQGDAALSFYRGDKERTENN